MREGGDSSWFDFESFLLHLERGELDMVIHTTLGEKGDILKALVVIDNMVKVGVTFTADVLKGLDFEAKLGRVLGTAFGVHLAMSDDRLQPGKVFVVMRDDDLKVQSLARGG